MFPHGIFQENKDIWNDTIYYSSAVIYPEAIFDQIVLLKRGGFSSIWGCFKDHIFQDLEVSNKASSSM